MLRRQVTRMLRRPARGGAGQQLRRAMAAGAERRHGAAGRRIFYFDESLRQSFMKETTLLVDSIFREDRSLLDSAGRRLHLLNQRLAEHYGVPNVYGSHFRRVTHHRPESARPARPGQHPDGHVVSQPHVRRAAREVGAGEPAGHAAAASAARRAGFESGAERQGAVDATSRCKCIARTPSARRATAGWTRSDLPSRTTTASGRWRDEDAGGTIDASGTLAGRHAVPGARPGCASCCSRNTRTTSSETATEKLLTYALGRGLEYYRLSHRARDCPRGAAKDDYRISSLILGVVNSTPFQMRRVSES